MVWLPMFLIFNVHTDVNACNQYNASFQIPLYGPLISSTDFFFLNVSSFDIN